jgi:CheY-like chemotaxis protein
MINVHSILPPSLLAELDQVFHVTPAGQAELGGGMTHLSDTELVLLVRLDGRLPLAQIRKGMADVPTEAFAAAFQSLLDQRLLCPVAQDGFDLQLQSHLNSFSAAIGVDADAGVVSLRRAGYFVGIARQRANAASTRRPDAALSAVVVEDEPVLAKFVKSYLAFDGIQVRVAGNRAEISAELSRRPVPDLLLLDVMLPDADGFDILRRVRAHPVLKDVPVIMLTGKATREAVLQGMEAGADGYVTKPFEAEALMRAVRTVLDLPAADAPTADPWMNADAKNSRVSARPF